MKAARDHLVRLSEQPPGAVDVENVADILIGVDAELRGTPGMRCLLDQPAVADAIADLSVHIGEQIEGLEARIAQPIAPAEDFERLNAAMVTLKDVWWAIGKDRLGFATQVAELAGGSPSGAALDAYAAIQVALSSLDRLELRGRDSAGLHVMVTGHDIDFSEPRIAATLADRCVDPLFTSTAVRTPAGHLSIVYKCAAEIGRLGDNGRALRAAIADDELLAEAFKGAHSSCFGCRAHPLGKCGDDQPGQRASPDKRGTHPFLAACGYRLRGRGSQWRRGQLCRPHR